MKKWIFVLALILLTGVVSGCSQTNDVEGRWISIIKNDWDGTKIIRKMDIKKNGENYIINVVLESYKDTGKTGGEMGKKAAWDVKAPETISAPLKDGKLIVDPFTSFTYIKNDKSILGPKGEIYKKETQEEMNRLKKEVAASFKERYPKMVIEE